VVNKPSGLLTHRGWDRDRIVAMTVARDRTGKHVYPVHRLDRPTSGALMFALTQEAARTLAQGFEHHKIEKTYIALVRGRPKETSGTIDYPIPKKPKGERVPAQTDYRVLCGRGRYALVEARPKTGRLHQIRRHLRHIGHPLIGDVNYGVGSHNRLFREQYDLWRLALHALSLRVSHPTTHVPLELIAPLPEDLSAPLEAAGFPLEKLGLPTLS
jgi:tRNA pseudouridine65 synthase